MPHTCHARGCEVRVPPRMFMCRRHWYMVPKPMRDAVWATYVPGQERRMDPTRAYLDATRAAINFVYAHDTARVDTSPATEEPQP